MRASAVSSELCNDSVPSFLCAALAANWQSGQKWHNEAFAREALGTRVLAGLSRRSLSQPPRPH